MLCVMLIISYLPVIFLLEIKMTKILITGGAGFIGSHLSETLAKDENNTVYSLDNYFTGTVKNHVANVHYINGTTKDIDKLIDFIPDIIFHLGEYSRVEQSFEDIDLVWEYNKLGTLAVLEFVRKTRAKLIYAGSSTKFGDSGTGRNQSPYAWSKSSNTELVKNYGEWFGIDYAITYFYNAYGRREIESGKYATLIAIYKYNMRNNLPLKVVEPGTQLRNFTHVSDIVNGLVLVGKSGHGDEYGIGNSEAYSIVDVAKLFGGEIEWLPPRKGNRMSAEVITEKIRSLGWKPQICLRDYVNSLRINNWHDEPNII